MQRDDPRQPELSSKRSRSDQYLSATTICIAVVVAIVCGTYALEGRTTATRTLTAICMPLGILWLVLLGSAITFSHRKRKSVFYAFLASFLLLSVGSNPVASSLFLGQVEWPETEPSATTADPFRCVIVLGGGISVTSNGTPEANREGERIISAAQLWHQGLTQSILCTGATPSGTHDPSDVGKELLISLGVPAEVIFKIGGENTSQEMKKLDLFFRQLPAGFPDSNGSSKIGLITSAFHLSRAVRLAQAEGVTDQVDLEPIPTAFRQSTLGGISPRLLVPSAESAMGFGLAMKESLAKIVGR
jgi:uncharacterized SAM-binding protein YcdF (DUF218 family)